jgi:alpha-beta hydrolase superfamily lysophospholipase
MKRISIFIRRILILCILLFVFVNIIACFHAYKFTHYATDAAAFPKNPEKMGMQQKISSILFGVDLPRPKNSDFPKRKFETVVLNDQLECWEIPAEDAKGTVILFHGYGNRKSGMLDRANEFYKMGYNTVLPDFTGSGGSKGNTTTIGFKEADEVKECYDYYTKKYPGKPMFLMGTSMGAAAILKCMHDHKISPNAIILECPFGTMYQTVCNRFDAMKVPSMPMAALLVFYGGMMNGFWAFDHNPIDYAKKVNCPTLLLSGGSDERVSLREIDDIYNNLQGEKQKIIYPRSGHESYLNKYAVEWRQDVDCFLEGK